MPEEGGHVAVVVKLVRVAPHADRHDLSNPTKASSSATSRHLHFIRYLKPLIDLEKQAQGAEVVVSEAVPLLILLSHQCSLGKSSTCT